MSFAVVSEQTALINVDLSEDRPTGPGANPPPVTLLQMMTGYWVSQALYVAAKLGVADLLADGPRPVEDLAAATQTDAASLRRVLRALASVGVFTEASPGAFALTPLAALLRTGTLDSMRALRSCTPRSSTAPGATYSTACRPGRPPSTSSSARATSRTSPNTRGRPSVQRGDDRLDYAVRCARW